MIEKNIFSLWLYWRFFEVPKGILKAWKNFLKFSLSYFSIAQLLKSFFSPWRRYTWIYPRGFDAGKYLEVFFSNLISRTLGAIFRTFLIVTGILFEIFIVFTGLFILLGWLSLPFFLTLGIYHGFRILF